ncbi:MAG: anaerobic glycerol-3-phosphate dehydrogenase subunit A [Bacteroidales bacterium]|nr:anaerobic glycerol-3-phosphate dehydrogenase subunit A [Bacteroidales bacterium]
MKEYDVIIIGGGITGTGTARDCAMRGLRTLLIERYDLTTGATGRNHGLLHSGARYAVTDPESARECIKENMILRKIASNCIEETGGLFVSLPEDGDDFRKTFLKSCHACGISAREISPDEARAIEPAVSPDLTGAVKVPDASIDPFILTSANMLDATIHGAEVLTYHEVTGLILEGGAVVGVSIADTRNGEISEIRAAVVVNAAGIWGKHIAKLAGIEIDMCPTKGSLLIFGHRINGKVINRCRKPSDADILVPGGVVSVLGTTGSRIPFDQCDNVRVSSDEVETLLREGSRLVPALEHTRVLRAYAGVRPLVSGDADPTGRSVSRGIVLLDHETRDGVSGFITITGGKLTCYRLMAEKATDLVCRKLHVNKPCRTAERILPGSESRKKEPKSDSMGRKAAVNRHGTRAEKINFSDKSQVLCGCEHVTRAEIEYAVKYLDVTNLIDLRRRTRVGMGTCQGTFCTDKVAEALAEALGTPEKKDELIRQYISERWKGITPVCWGETLREMEFMRKKYGA